MHSGNVSDRNRLVTLPPWFLRRSELTSAHCAALFNRPGVTCLSVHRFAVGLIVFASLLIDDQRMAVLSSFTSLLAQRAAQIFGQ